MNAFGNRIKVEIFGESHGKAVGVTVDGLPAGIKVDEGYIVKELMRRKSDGALGTPRVESDMPEIISGVYNGYTTGSPISALIYNENKKSSDYASDSVIPRPSHADYTAYVKYCGFSDPRGGGHFSGRLTAPLVFAGALCSYYLMGMGITLGAHLIKAGRAEDAPFDPVNVDADILFNLKNRKIPCSHEAEKAITSEIEAAREAGDSIGGVVECAVLGLMPGAAGSPFFNSVESAISAAVFSVPGVKGIEFGAGFSIAGMRGSFANDSFYMANGAVKTRTNNSGGIQGGISNGMPVIFRAAIKPTPSIFRPQQSVELKTGKDVSLEIKGRHDPCIALRAVPAVEAAAAIAITDLIL